LPPAGERVKNWRSEFAERFGVGEPPSVYFAPGRVNLIGEHTDYNGGLVLPVATERGTYVLLRPKEGPPTRVYSTHAGEELRLDLRHLKRRGDWGDYVRGVLQVLGDEDRLPDFDALILGDLPLEAGLSSSASLEVALATATRSLGAKLTPEQAALVAWRAENEFVGVPCGIMDQFAVALAREGHALLLDCSSRRYRHVPCDLPGTALLVAHTGVKRSLSASLYRRRREECAEALRIITGFLGPRENLSRVTPEELDRVKDLLPETLRLRAEHVVGENRRVREAVSCLEGNDPERLGELLNLSHASLRDLYRVSSPELDALQEISLAQPGVHGCRLTGAGFGGCVVVLLREEALASYLEEVPERYRQATGREPFFMPFRPAAGARRING